MSLKKAVFVLVKNIYSSIPKIIPGYMGKRFRAESAESLVVVDEVTTKYGKLKYYCMGWIPLWRSQTLFIKEPEMIEWIDKMDKNETLWDIGANVGLYSVYAGLKGMQVFAFEPSALNTFLISKNIEINNLKDNVFLFPVAVSDKNEFGYLNMTSTDLGGALNEFNETDIQTVGEGSYKAEVVFKQGMFAYSTDELIEKYGFEVPDYIKIDVDSIEDRIVYGANKTLSNKKLKGVFLELDETEERTQKLIDFLSDRGLKLKEKRQSPYFKDSKFSTQFNYIFERV
ncbi:FkbM family methyltransferase [Sulfurimonas sp. NW7]|uniref:FkbM family methyltransferase n=1 Tax=Sulfurimonas sp. NW7 TaxID=2922727 RepID=UPI003DA95561